MAQEPTGRDRLPHGGREGGRSTALRKLLLKALRWIGKALLKALQWIGKALLWIGKALYELFGEDVLQWIAFVALVLGGALLLSVISPSAVDWALKQPDDLGLFLLFVLALIVICVAAGAAVLLVRGARWVRGHVRWTSPRGAKQ